MGRPVRTIPLAGGGDTITFYLENGQLTDWIKNDREEVTRQYLSEFAAQDFTTYPNIYKALSNVLNKLPQDIFLRITDRAYILGEGRILASGTPREITENPDARKAYLGEDFRMDFHDAKA